MSGCPVDNDNNYDNIPTQVVEKVGLIVPSSLSWIWRLLLWLLPILLAIGFVWGVMGKITAGGLVLIGVLIWLFIIFRDNMNGSNLEGSLSPAVYPVPPHLNHLGVSNSNQSCVGCI